MSVPVRRLLAVATALLVLGGAGLPAPASAQTPESAPSCFAANLSLREAPSPDGVAPSTATVFVVRNLGTMACRITGGLGIRLFDADGNAIPLRFAPRTMMALLLTLAPGAEASFTIGFGPHDAARCTIAARVEVAIPGQLPALGAPVTMTACSDAVATVSNLRLGLSAPLPPPSRFTP